MIIFGTRATRKLLERGNFYCPQCQGDRDFEMRRAKQWFHIYFIPLIPLNTYPPYVECKTCRATFVEGVLNSTSDADIRAEFETATIQILARMAWADGIIQPEERSEIFKVVNDICAKEFSMEDVNQAIADAENHPEDALAVASRVSGMLNDRGKELIVAAVYDIAASDGDFADEEKEMILEIGAGLGLRPAYINGLMAELIERNPIGATQS